MISADKGLFFGGNTNPHLYINNYIYCHFLKHMKHFQLKSRASMRASISHVRARDARAFQTRARETREQRQARARDARARRASHHARAPRAHTSRTSRAHLAHVARARRTRTNKLSKSKISSPNGDLESLFPRAVSLFGIWRAYSCARDVRERRAQGARARCASCAREVREVRARGARAS